LKGPLPQQEFDWIFSRVPRLTVEVVIASPDRGVLLALREFGPCAGLWHLPGGTVRFGEPVTRPVARQPN
jgi:ADP-ribose pyrophosphatase YjhB (NUDIX family)